MKITFDDFWNAYPLRTAKKAAQRAWARVPADKHDTLLAALKKQKQYAAWKKTTGAFVPSFPYAATWLNGERWEDEVPAIPSNPSSTSHTSYAVDRLIEYCKARRPLADMTLPERDAAYNLLRSMQTTWPDLRIQLLEDPTIEARIRELYGGG